MADPTLLILASLAEGGKHGYAMMEDIGRFAGVSLGPARSTARLRAWRRGEGSARFGPPIAANPTPLPPPAAVILPGYSSRSAGLCPLAAPG